MSERHSRISLEWQESWIKIYSLSILCTSKLEEKSLDVDGYVKSMEAIRIRIQEEDFDSYIKELEKPKYKLGVRVEFVKNRISLSLSTPSYWRNYSFFLFPQR